VLEEQDKATGIWMQETPFSAFCAGICHKSWVVYTGLELCTWAALVLVVFNHQVLVQDSCLLRLCYMSNCNRIYSSEAKDSCSMENEFNSWKFMWGCSVDFLVHWILHSTSLDLCCKSQVLGDHEFEVCLLIM